jgi:SpoOM protein
VAAADPGQAAGPTGLARQADSGGVAWGLELDRAVLVPGRLVGGRVHLTSHRDLDARGLVIALVAVEHWRHRVTSTDAHGNAHTEVVTTRAELTRVPVQLAGEIHIGPGESRDWAFELPVPPMGPASLDANDAGLDWTVEAKLDIPGGFDSSIEAPVVVAQPTALLRAGAIDVGQFALFDSADVGADGIRGSILLEPMPLVCGEAFAGHLALEMARTQRLQEIRAELRLEVKATVSGGESEAVTVWAGQLAAGGDYAGAQAFPIEGRIDARPLPTSELPHGRARATFHVILARAWAVDAHLARDVTIATTREV